MMPRLFPRWERVLFHLMPGYCPLCLGWPLPGLPWCGRCYQALPRNHHPCQLCAEPLTTEQVAQGVCERCLAMPGFLHQAWAPLLFKDEVAGLVHRYKSHAHSQSGRLLVELALSVLMEQQPSEFFERLSECDALLPVPPDAKRQRERGFDHVAWLAQRLARMLGLPLIKARRQLSTGSQRGLSRAERWRNLSGLFVLDKTPPARVLIVDDVMTTGATLEVLARATFDKGAEWVGGLALARTPGR